MKASFGNLNTKINKYPTRTPDKSEAMLTGVIQEWSCRMLMIPLISSPTLKKVGCCHQRLIGEDIQIALEHDVAQVLVLDPQNSIQGLQKNKHQEKHEVESNIHYDQLVSLDSVGVKVELGIRRPAHDTDGLLKIPYAAGKQVQGDNDCRNLSADLLV